MKIMNHRKILFVLTVILLLTLAPGFAQENGPPPMPTRNRDQKTTPPVTVQNLDELKSLISLDEEASILIELYAFKVELDRKHQLGIDWNKNELGAVIGKPVKGEYTRGLKKPENLIIETLVISDYEDFMKYLEQFGNVNLIYSQVWSQTLGEQSSRRHDSVIPYKISFPKQTGTGEYFSDTYARSNVRVGMTTYVSLSGLQFSGNSPSVDITFEIELRDAYKTKDNLFAVHTVNSADVTTIPISQTLIQTSLVNHGDSTEEYLFLITPRIVK